MSDSINSIKPGEQMTPEQKAKLAADNLTASNEAMRLASVRRQQDIEQGREQPLANTLAQSIKEKLEREEFQKKE